MHTSQYFKSKVFTISSHNFEELALELFQYQVQHNEVYRTYVENLRGQPDAVQHLSEIPFLPISFFKTHEVSSRADEPVEFFASSGTTGSTPSRHPVYDPAFYDEVCLRHFEEKYGPLSEYFIAALLPSYLERKGSSLIRMAAHFTEQSGDEDSGFFLDNLRQLSQILAAKKKAGRKILLLGVTFALLDLAEVFPQNLSGATIMETGGMKGRRKEMIRPEVHAILKKAFAVENIHSEYGMTELFSQAYSRGEGLLETPPWMKVQARQVDDPFAAAPAGKTGGLNVIDLANVDSCAFVETQDLARVHADESFEVMGRYDQADVRGCNLMVI